MTDRTCWIFSILAWLSILALGICFICASGCQSATHESVVIRTPATEMRRTEGRRYFRVRVKNGTVRYFWVDEQGEIHWKKEAKK